MGDSFERNADVVSMASYAPLFAHVSGWQWTPDLIWFDNARSYRTPNYYVQQFFSLNKGSEVIPLLQDWKAVTGQDSCCASAVVDSATHELIIKIVNLSKNATQKNIQLADARVQGEALLTSLGFNNPGVTNGLDQENVVPVATHIPVKGRRITVPLQPYSLIGLRAKL